MLWAYLQMPQSISGVMVTAYNSGLFLYCSQKPVYSPIALSPYQFEKSTHWLRYVDSIPAPSVTTPAAVEPDETSLLSFVKGYAKNVNDAVFSVDQRSEEFRLLTLGHAVLGNPLCPVALYLELVSRAARMIKPDSAASGQLSSVEDLHIRAPLGLDRDRAIILSLSRISGSDFS